MPGERLEGTVEKMAESVAESVAGRLAELRRRLERSERAAGRPPGAVRLLAVSKGQPLARLREAWACGLRAFGESYLQEALAKMEALRSEALQSSPAAERLRDGALESGKLTAQPGAAQLGSAQPGEDDSLEWHFIGRIQANKTAGIARHFAWVHSLSTARQAQRLSRQRPADQAALNVCLQMRLKDGGHGAAPQELAALAEQVEALPGLRLRGLMGIAPPPVAAGAGPSQRHFMALAEAFERLKAGRPEVDTLSMGMSADLEEAVSAGATLVRVGTALFGERGGPGAAPRLQEVS